MPRPAAAKPPRPPDSPGTGSRCCGQPRRPLPSRRTEVAQGGLELVRHPLERHLLLAKSGHLVTLQVLLERGPGYFGDTLSFVLCEPLGIGAQLRREAKSDLW